MVITIPYGDDFQIMRLLRHITVKARMIVLMIKVKIMNNSQGSGEIRNYQD